MRPKPSVRFAYISLALLVLVGLDLAGVLHLGLFSLVVLIVFGAWSARFSLLMRRRDL